MGVIGIHGRLNDPIALVLLYECRLNKLLFVLSFVCARIINEMLTNGLCVCVVYFGDMKKKNKNREIEKYPVDVHVYCVVTSSSKS